MKNIIDYVLGKTFYAKQFKHLGDFGKTLDFLKLDNILEEKPLKQKTQKI